MLTAARFRSWRAGTREQYSAINQLLYDFQASRQESGVGLTAGIGFLWFAFAIGEGGWGLS